MTLEQLDQIVWWAYFGGFGFALVGGQALIPKVVKNMYELVEPGFEEKRYKYKWQPRIVGIIETFLYILAFLGEHAEFIGLWVALKVSIPYIGWKDDKNDKGDKGDPGKGRSKFINSLYGNALSILYSVVGYLMILWLSKGNYCRAVWVPAILCSINLALWGYLKIYQKRMSEN